MTNKRSLKSKLLLYMGLILFTIPVIFPIYWMVVSSIKTPEDLFTIPPELFPTGLSFESYVQVILHSDIPRYLLNSFIIAILTTLISLFICVLAAYSFARFDYPGKRIVLISMLFSYIIPPVLLFLPFYMILSKIGMINTYSGIIAAHLTLVTPFLLWMMMPFFKAIPRSLEEAAMVDGASITKVFTKIVLPLAVPGIFSSGIFAFTFSWNEFLYSSVILMDEKLRTIPVGISGFVSSYDIRWGAIMASSVLAAIPVVLVFRLIQNYFIEGLTAGAVKG